MNVLLPDPVVDSIDPESGVVGSIVSIDDLAGSGFAAPARVQVSEDWAAGHRAGERDRSLPGENRL